MIGEIFYKLTVAFALYAVSFAIIYGALMLLSGCGELEEIINPPASPTATPVSTAPPTPEPLPQNPPCDEVMTTDGNAPPEGGFLMKNGDHTRKAVILFPARYVVPFDSVTVERRNGESEEFYYTGKSNHTRQTWRGERRVRGYVDDRRRIRIEARLGDDVCLWIIEDADNRRND